MLITESVFALFPIHAISGIVHAPVMLAHTKWMSVATCTCSGSTVIVLHKMYCLLVDF